MTAFALLGVFWDRRGSNDVDELESVLLESANDRKEITEELFQKGFTLFDNVEDLPSISKQDLIRKRKSTALSGDRKTSNIHEYDYDYGDEDEENANQLPSVDIQRANRFKSLLFHVNRGNIRELKISNII